MICVRRAGTGKSENGGNGKHPVLRVRCQHKQNPRKSDPAYQTETREREGRKLSLFSRSSYRPLLFRSVPSEQALKDINAASGSFERARRVACVAAGPHWLRRRRRRRRC